MLSDLTSAYSAGQIAAVFATYLFAGAAKGVTGLGFSTMCLPFLAVAVGLKEALPLVIIPSVAANILVMVQAGKFSATVRRFWPMLLATVPGLLIGLWMLARIDGRLAGALLGVVLVLWSLFSLAKPGVALAPGPARRLAPLSGFLTGIVNGVTGSQVIPSLPYLMALKLDRAVFIQAMNCSFTLSSIIMAIGLQRLGIFTFAALVLSVMGVGVAFAGVAIGGRVRDRLSPDAFRIGVLIMLVAMGISLTLRAI
ncbi:sulfite exporter TauE/SafE family protein [Roseovarius pelagicus]|uniref:Probable membrane transporter protein n=1 Tax=Roseovarius pelagicus TaxID=2980108 RepID=A0ABY6D870_9RHOB|nr:sulfite exporter TauE/SafE family protein [Roseovarius pelagicus]UXX82336.1 sulfite exporter TauE/SafE family protein [Roseovarius pelagicus]